MRWIGRERGEHGCEEVDVLMDAGEDGGEILLPGFEEDEFVEDAFEGVVVFGGDELDIAGADAALLHEESEDAFGIPFAEMVEIVFGDVKGLFVDEAFGEDDLEDGVIERVIGEGGELAHVFLQEVGDVGFGDDGLDFGFGEDDLAADLFEMGEDVLEESVFAGVVVIEGALFDGDLIAELADADIGVAFLGKEVDAGIEELLFGGRGFGD